MLQTIEQRRAVLASGRVVGGYRRWLEREARSGAKRPLSPEESIGGGRVLSGPQSVAARGIIRGVAIDVPAPSVNANRWAATEVYLSVAQGFTPTPNDLVDSGRKTHFELTDDGAAALVSGMTYYIRAAYRDINGRLTGFSDEVSAEAGKVSGSSIDSVFLYSVADDLSGSTINPGIWQLDTGAGGGTSASGDATTLEAAPGDYCEIVAYRASYASRGVFEQESRWKFIRSDFDSSLSDVDFVVGMSPGSGVFPGGNMPGIEIVKGSTQGTILFRTKEGGEIAWTETDNIPLATLGTDQFATTRIRVDPTEVKLYVNDALAATHSDQISNVIPYFRAESSHGSRYGLLSLDYVIQMYV